MLTLLLLAQVPSQAITFREPFSPTTVTRLTSGCGNQSVELRWTVLRGQESRFDEISTNGTPLPVSEIEALNRWKGERSIAVVDVICEPDGPRVRTRLLVKFERAERVGLPNLEGFEIVGNRLVFEAPHLP